MNEFKFESANGRNIIKVGAIYKHEHGLKYRVDSDGIDQSSLSDNESLLDVTDYEQGKEPEPFDISKYSQQELDQYILYTQLEAGSYSAGQKWVRKREDFLNHFTESSNDGYSVSDKILKSIT